MTPEQAKMFLEITEWGQSIPPEEIIDVIEAYAAGHEIEWKSSLIPEKWSRVTGEAWQFTFPREYYRIKLKFKPFDPTTIRRVKNGTIVTGPDYAKHEVLGWNDEGVILLSGRWRKASVVKYEQFFHYLFMDGTPCGAMDY